MLAVRAFMLLGMVLATPTGLDLQQIERMLDPASARLADHLDIVSSGGQLSHIDYETNLPPKTAVLPSPLPKLTVAPRLQRFGAIIGGAAGYRLEPNRSGGFRVDLASVKQVRNILPYQQITLSGIWEGTWQIALMDESQANRNEQTVLGNLGQSGSTAYSLNATVATKTDLSRARFLVITLISPRGWLNLKSLTFSRVDLTPLPKQRGVWILNSHRLLKNAATVAKELASKGVNRAYVQIDDDPGQLYPFVSAAKDLGITVFALEGSPDHLRHGAPLVTRIAAIIAYNQTYGDAQFAGVQVDIAPHDLQDFGIRRAFYTERYLALLQEISTQCRSIIPLSVMVPHWLAEMPGNGSSLIAKTCSLVDEVVITTEQTQFSELELRTRDTLLWAEHFNLPVFIGLRAGAVPDEGHRVLKRNGVKTGKNVLNLAGIAWQQESSYTIRSNTLSFYGQPAALNELLTRTIPSPVFAGWVVNSYENLH
jgi:hypothetical protein